MSANPCMLTVPITVSAVDGALAAAARAAEHGADLVEYRVDGFMSDPAAVVALVERSPLPCVLTCRDAAEGGAYDGDDAYRATVLERVIGAPRPPSYVDVELASFARSPELRRIASKPDRTRLILSAHDFAGRPADLERRIEVMADEPACHVIKVAWTARSLRDNLEAFEIIGRRVKPTIALCMGAFGLPSRVLAGKFGALLTFAALDAGSGTAPGQPTVTDLKRLYRWDAVKPATAVYGVIGYPVGHSMSPPIHNAGFTAAAVDAVYLPLAIPPEYEHFKATVGTWLDFGGLNFRGASVTIPHKQNLLRYVAEHGGRIEALAERIGAANTLHKTEEGALYAANTDYAAALDAVCAALGIERAALCDRRVAVIGAGGAARAIVAGFAHHGATVVIYNRTQAKAEALAIRFNGESGKVVAAPLAKLCDTCCDVVINCTPIGMHPNVDDTPLRVPPAAETVVFDTIYNPPRTRLLREAADAGCGTIAGTEMFVRQGAAQFALWTGKQAPLDVFGKVMERELR